MESAIDSFLHNYNDDLEIINELSFQHLGFDLRNPCEGTLTFCNSADFLQKCISIENISVIITQRKYFEQIQEQSSELTGRGFILTRDPKNLFFRFHNFLANIGLYSKDSFPSIIAETAEIGTFASIAPFNVIIGEHSIIEDFVVIKSNVSIGEYTRIQSGTVIGNDCLQCSIDMDGLFEVTHVGGVKIGSYVKIESNSLVCKHIFDDVTLVMDHAKIGGLVHVSHGCKIGERSILTANILLGGSTHIGSDTFIGPNVTTVPLITIGNKSRLTVGSVVTRDVEPGSHVTGNFAISHEKFIENLKKSL